jgi:hypothetical protein
MFWIATVLSLAVGALVITMLLMILAGPRTTGGWAWTVGLGLLGAWIGFVALSIGLNTSRGFERGASEADRGRGDRFEAHGRSAGRVVGRGLAAVTGRTRRSQDVTSDGGAAPPTQDPTPPTGDPMPTPSSSPTPPITVDRSARVLGQMVGRRMVERRDRKGS